MVLRAQCTNNILLIITNVYIHLWEWDGYIVGVECFVYILANAHPYGPVVVSAHPYPHGKINGGCSEFFHSNGWGLGVVAHQGFFGNHLGKYLFHKVEVGAIGYRSFDIESDHGLFGMVDAGFVGLLGVFNFLENSAFNFLKNIF